MCLSVFSGEHRQTRLRVRPYNLCFDILLFADSCLLMALVYN